MTEQQALLFMTTTIVVCEDEDGTAFGVCTHDDVTDEHSIESPDRLASHRLDTTTLVSTATAGVIASMAGAKIPYVDGETVLLMASSTQAVSAVYPDEPQWVEDTTSICLGTAGLYAMFSSMDPDALVAAAEGKSNPWTRIE